MLRTSKVHVLFLTGAIGVGKTVVATEVGVLLGERSLPHAIVDLDWLGWIDVGPAFHAYDRLIMRNLATIWPNPRETGVSHLVLTRGLTERGCLDALRRIFPEAEITVIRLTAAPARRGSSVAPAWAWMPRSGTAGLSRKACWRTSSMNRGAPEATTCGQSR
ncbi:MAG: hypothetical protein M3Z66_14515 [Chloroflexota bacterium]|nr:hypothetical protein [Chloroflexota bacterium]